MPLQTTVTHRSWPSVTCVSLTRVNTVAHVTWSASNSTAASAHLVTMVTSVNTRSTRVSVILVRMEELVRCLMTTAGSGMI